MMSIDNKEEVGAQGQRLNEPNIGVPIKKRPFQLTNPLSLASSDPSLDKFCFTPNHFTAKTPLNVYSSDVDAGNPSSSNMYKPASVQTHPLHDINAIDMEGNYCPLKPNTNSSLGMEMPQFGSVPELHLSISGNMVKNEKNNECLTDLSLTGPTTSNACLKPSHNLSNQKEKRSVFDLNLPTNETWDSALDGFTSENNGIAHSEPVKVLGKQGSVGGMIPHGVGSGVIPNVAVAGLVPTGSGNNLNLLNTRSKSFEMHNPSEVTLDLQLKLPPRPQLRMKDLEPFCSSDLSLSSSGKDSSSCPEPVNVKTKVVENSQKCDAKSIINSNVETTTQNQIMVKQESREVSLPENVLQKSGLQDQSLASGSVVKKEPVDTSNAQHPLGKLLDESPCSGSLSILDKRTEISKTNSLTKGIDLNSAAPLPEATTGGKTVNPVLTERVLAGEVTQNAISQSDVCHDPENVDNGKQNLNTSCLAVTSSSLVCSEDIKPVITTCTSPGLVVDNGKRITSDGLSQGSAEMDCSEEGQNLSNSATICKTVEKENCENNGSSSSSIGKIPKQEPGLVGEFENAGIRATPSGENVKSLLSSSIPNSKEDQIQTPMPVEASSVQNNESDTPSSCTKMVDVPDKNIHGVFLDMEAGCSKSRSPSSSRSMRDRDVELSSERENVTSHRQTEGNDILHRRVKRADLDPDRAQFERKRSRWSSWDERSNLHSNRGQRWEGPRFSQFDGDRFENEDSINMANRNRQTNNRFNSRFGHTKYSSFRFTRTNNNSGINFDEGNDRRNNRPHPRFQNRRHIADISPRRSDELDAPDFEHNNHYKRVDHTMYRESSSPGTRRRLPQWTPPGEMIAGNPELLTRVDTGIRSPGLRPFFKKDNLSRRHVSTQYNRGRKPGRGMHWNIGRQQRYDMVNPHGSVTDVQDLDAYAELRCHGGKIMPIHRRYPDGDGAYSDGDGPHGRVRNYDIAMTRRREMGEQDEYRYNNNRGSHGWHDGNPNNGSDKSKRRRY